MAALFIILLATPFSKELGHGYVQTETDAFDGVHGKLATTFFGVLQRRIWNITQHCQFVKREASIIHQFINPIHRIHIPKTSHSSMGLVSLWYLQF